ncbi:uncharacterized protein BDZ99DRAFT_498359 [Mytilinidion resinicola]|uniref:Fungal N-terminal domain-containing protein n=1 Tax=Mytilinidion resinicola TaxID=574789 RepID=A0A6A6YQM0_9PEZI|nr:uncharacterized protein BDZ99DRAFT_498359 [Mytilinidion resinicola]KAF2810177.1 hypothetical protein BDZ99DRAFT_498359 [Mytilinidion resinicola]
MAEITSIISHVTWGCRLSLALYRFGALSSVTRDMNRIARNVSLFSLTLKHIGATFKEDDSMPSLAASKTIEEILDQCQNIFREIEALVPVDQLHEKHEESSASLGLIRAWKWSLTSKTRIDYLVGYLKSLKLTLSVMLQSLYTAKIIRWTRTHPAISPARMAESIQNEKLQMEILIIEQQLSLFSASKLYDELRRSEEFSSPRLLENNDTSNSIIVIEEQTKLSAMTPTSLVQYQESSLAQLPHKDPEELPQVLLVSTGHIDHLIAKWTRLQEILEEMDRMQREAEEQTRQQQYDQRQNQQPTVESDDTDDQLGALPGVKRTGRRVPAPIPQRPSSIQPLFPDSPTLPIPVPDIRFGSTAPISPPSSQYGVSPRSSGILATSPSLHSQSPQSPRTSISSLPVRAAAAVTAKDEDESADLQIPWRICVKRLYWEYIDGKVVRSNTELPASTPFTDRNSWTEILASWVCKEALKEGGYDYTQIKKERNEGGRTKLETAFSIPRPLTFAEVEYLVERTVEMYRQRQRPRSPKRRSSSSSNTQHYPVQPRIPSAADRTPRPFPPPIQTHPPPLDRATTFPGPNPNYNPFSYSPASLNVQHQSYPAPYAPHYNQAPPTPRSAHQGTSFSNDSPRSSTHNHVSSYSTSHLDVSTTSDSDVPAKPKSRRSSSGSRRRPSSSGRRSVGSSAVGTLAKVGGLAVLLDGIV